MHPSPSATRKQQDELIRALQNPALYDHPIEQFSVLETHISWVILTGLFAYKIKKPVNFGFIDFSTLEKRRHFCQQELKLNRRFAPKLYLDVVSIHGSRQQPTLSGDDPVIEYAMRMREFPQHKLLSRYASEQRLLATHIDAMADNISGFHDRAQRAEPDSIFASIDTILLWSRENIEHIEAALPTSLLPAYFDELKASCLILDSTFQHTIEQRKADGFIRLCHGDLHLGNMALIDNQVTAFDCIEFNPELHWIDTISDAAFVVMDLQARAYPGFSWRFINRYLQSNGDYAGLQMLRYYVIYRALVRAKVEALAAQQHPVDHEDDATRYQHAMHYISLAQRWNRKANPGILLMHGLSGSGKSSIARQLVEVLGAIQIRSDVERKRMAGLNADECSGSGLGENLYTSDTTRDTYHRLTMLTRLIIQAGYPVIVDATFLKQWQRDQFTRQARQNDTPLLIIRCEAPLDLLKERIKQRRREDADASEATLDVLQQQIESQDALNSDEAENSLRVQINDNTKKHSSNHLSNKQINRIKNRLDEA